MSTIIAKIDISGPTGRRILRKLEAHPKVAKIEYKVPEELAEQELLTVEEAFSGLRKRVKEHYAKK